MGGRLFPRDLMPRVSALGAVAGVTQEEATRQGSPGEEANAYGETRDSKQAVFHEVTALSASQNAPMLALLHRRQRPPHLGVKAERDETYRTGEETPESDQAFVPCVRQKDHWLHVARAMIAEQTLCDCG